MRKEIIVNGKSLFYDALEKNEATVIKINGKEFSFENIVLDNEKIIVEIDNKKESYYFKSHKQQLFCDIEGKFFHAKKMAKNFSKSEIKNDDGLVSPMPGKIIKIHLQKGEAVMKGDPVVVMEAMKMEHTLTAGKDGVIVALNCEEGELVEGGVTLVELGESNDSKEG